MTTLRLNPLKGYENMNVFKELFNDQELQTNIESEKQDMKEKQEQMTLSAQGHFCK